MNINHNGTCDNPLDVDDLEDETENRLVLLNDFKLNHNHSLRISASNVAAIAGFNPWKNLPELVLDLVYQGSLGRMLMKADANLLGLRIVVDEDIQLHELAAKSMSIDVQRLVSKAIDIKNGTNVPTALQDVQQLKNILNKERSVLETKLSSNEQKVLYQKINHAIDTGYGTAHETDALDLYEKQTGWSVDERNSEVYIWPFQLISTQQQQNTREQHLNHSDIIISAIPLIPRAVSCSEHYLTTRATELDTDIEINQGDSDKTIRSISETEEGIEHHVSEKGINIDSTKKDQGDLTQNIAITETHINDKDDNKNRRKDESICKEIEKPYFSILGSVDGIRNELVIQQHPKYMDGNNIDTTFSDDDDDEEWIMKQVIVECKHRMGKLKESPPLYDQIQCIVYCLMHNVDNADLVEVIRNASGTDNNGAKGKVQQSRNSGTDDNGAKGKVQQSRNSSPSKLDEKDRQSKLDDYFTSSTCAEQENANATSSTSDNEVLLSDTNTEPDRTCNMLQKLRD